MSSTAYLPLLSANNNANHWLAHAKYIGNRLLGKTAFTKPANLLDLLPFQFLTTAVFLARITPKSSLRNLVIRIVQVGPGKKMIRIHARWIVTVMKNAECRWYFSMLNAVGNSMGALQCGESNTKISIPFPASSASPNPTPFGVVRPIHLLPEVLQPALRQFKLYRNKRTVIGFGSGIHSHVMAIVRAGVWPNTTHPLAAF